MALKKCSECGNNISSKAESCPQCGAPIKKARSKLGCGGLIVLVVLLGFISSYVSDFSKSREEAKQREVAASQEKIAKEKLQREKKAAQEYFENNKASIIENISDLQKQEKYDDVIREAVKYIDSKDTIILAMYASSKEAVLLKELRGIPSSDFQENSSRYKELSQLFPDNQKYKEKFEYYSGKQREKINKDREEAAKRKRIEDQFSGWDGSHIKLTRLVKNNLKDPDSYDHIETRFAIRDNHTDIIMKYRARNSFGGMVIETVSAKADFNGNIIEMSN